MKAVGRDDQVALARRVPLQPRVGIDVEEVVLDEAKVRKAHARLQRTRRAHIVRENTVRYGRDGEEIVSYTLSVTRCQLHAVSCTQSVARCQIHTVSYTHLPQEDLRDVREDVTAALAVKDRQDARGGAA